MYSTIEPKDDIGGESAETTEDDESSGSASDSNSEATATDDTQPPEDVSNTKWTLQNSAKLFL
jgi:hypothetical protein